MRQLLIALLLIYLAGLHGSIAVMEIASWTLVAVCLYQKIRNRGPVWFPLWKPLLGLFLSVFISLCLNPAGRTFLEQIGFMRWIVLLYFFTWILVDVWDPKFELLLKRFWVICLSVVGIYATFQCLTGIDLIRPEAHVLANHGDVWTATGFFSMSLTFAYCIGFSFAAILLPSRMLRPAIWSIAAFCFGSLALMASLARGAWLGIFVATLVYFACARRRLLPWLVGGMVAGIFILGFLHSTISQRLLDLVHLHTDHSILLRFSLWRAYFAMWQDHPIFGVGLFQGDLLLPEYYSRLGIVEDFTSHSHNVLLGWLAGAGIVGLAFYLWVSAEFLALAWALRRSTPWGWSLFLAQIFLHVGGLTENNFFDGEVNHFLVFGWAIVLALTHLQAKGRLLQSAPESS